MHTGVERPSGAKRVQVRVVQGWVTSWEERHQGWEELKLMHGWAE